MKVFEGRKKRLLWISGFIVLLVIALTALILKRNSDSPQVESSTETHSAVTNEPRQVTPTAGSSAGLVISGNVIDLNGAGIGNVAIYRSYASYAGDVIATTDANGNYASVFYPIPGDENVTIWAEKPGLSFEPEYYHWRHYYGYEQAEYSFQVKAP